MKEETQFEKSRRLLGEALDNMSDEEKDEWFPKDTTPKGWVSIEDNLPMMMAEDIISGGTEYKVKYKNLTEGKTIVSDHNTWYYFAKENNITHWYNA